MADLDALRSRLEQLAEDLGDAALQTLREAVEAGQTSRPDLERRLSRARAAVEKAKRELDGVRD